MFEELLRRRVLLAARHDDGPSEDRYHHLSFAIEQTFFSPLEVVISDPFLRGFACRKLALKAPKRPLQNKITIGGGCHTKICAPNGAVNAQIFLKNEGEKSRFSHAKKMLLGSS
ncbi:TPA: hypothetical protein ACNU3C_004476 [Aeromonas salmonicida subsp. salmonicida]